MTNILPTVEDELQDYTNQTFDIGSPQNQSVKTNGSINLLDPAVSWRDNNTSPNTTIDAGNSYYIDNSQAEIDMTDKIFVVSYAFNAQNRIQMQEIAERGAVMYLFNGSIATTIVSVGGTGYVNGEAVSLTGQDSSATDATGTLNVTAGVITSITITNAGTGYWDEVTNVIGGTGTGGIISVVPAQKEWLVGGQDTLRGQTPAHLPTVIDPTATENAEIGTFDLTNVLYWGGSHRRQNYPNTPPGNNLWVFYSRTIIMGTTIAAGNIPRIYGTGGNAGTLSSFVDEVLGNSLATIEHDYVSRVGTTFLFLIPMVIGNATNTLATAFDDESVSVIYPSSNDSADPRFQLTTDSGRWYLDLQSGDTAVFSGNYTWGVACPFDFDSSVGATVTLNNPIFNGMGNFNIGTDITGSASFLNLNGGSGDVDIATGCDLDGSTFDNVRRIIINGNTGSADFTVQNCQDGIYIDQPGTYTFVTHSYSGNTADITVPINTGVVVINVSGNGDIPTVADGGGTNDITVNIGSITISGLKTVTAGGTIGASILVENNTGTLVDFDSDNQTGTYTLNFDSTSTGTWTVIVKTPGYPHQMFTFDTMQTGGDRTGTFTQELSIDGDGTQLFTNSASSVVTIEIDNTTPQASIDIDDDAALAQGTWDDIELKLVTQIGMQWLADGRSDVGFVPVALGDFLFMSTKWRLRRDATNGGSNTRINAFVSSTDGTANVIDGTNGDVFLFQAVGQTQQEIANSMNLAPDGDAPTLETNSVQERLQDIQTTVNTINTNTDTIETILGTPTNVTVSQDIADVKTVVDSNNTAIGNLNDIDKTDVSNAMSDTATVNASSPTTDSPIDVIISSSEVGLSQQEVRDAMKLAATSGIPATGSIDDKLDTIDTVVDSIANDTVASRKILSNRYEITNTQLIIYDDDDSTPLFTFDLVENADAADSSGGRDVV